jgi:hypothetical protein
LRACAAVFDAHFADVPVETVHADAREYLRRCDRTFDVVAVDLYAADGYAEAAFDPGLWRDVRTRLAPGGVLLVNAWGLPHQLDPLVGASPQRAIVALIAKHFPDLLALPNRRNLTLIAGPDRRTAPPNFDGLRPHDRAYLATLPARLSLAKIDTVIGEPAADAAVLGSREYMNAEMERRWTSLTEAFREAGEASGIDQARSVPHMCITDPYVAQSITRQLLVTDPVAARFVPIAAAAAAFGNDHRVGWFGRWLVEQFEALAELSPTWLIETALPQAMAMVLCPLAPNWDWTAELCAVAEKLAVGFAQSHQREEYRA